MKIWATKPGPSNCAVLRRCGAGLPTLLSTVAVDYRPQVLRRPRTVAAGQRGPGAIIARRCAAHETCTEDDLLSIIQAAGWPIWPLILCSIAALTIIIERLISLRASQIAPASLLDEVLGVTRSSLPGSDVVNKLAENSLLGGVFATGLRSVIAEPRITEEAVRQSFESAGPHRAAPPGALPEHAGHHRRRGAAARAVRHGHRHDRDLRLAGAHRAAPTRSSWRTASRSRCTTPPSA